MFLVDSQWNPDAGWEQPEGTVVAPGRYTLVRLDWEWRQSGDDGLIEVPEDHLVRIKQPGEMQDGFMTRRQAE